MCLWDSLVTGKLVSEALTPSCGNAWLPVLSYEKPSRVPRFSGSLRAFNGLQHFSHSFTSNNEVHPSPAIPTLGYGPKLWTWAWEGKSQVESGLQCRPVPHFWGKQASFTFLNPLANTMHWINMKCSLTLRGFPKMVWGNLQDSSAIISLLFSLRIIPQEFQMSPA